MARNATFAILLALTLSAGLAVPATEALAHQPRVTPLPPEPAATIGGPFELVDHSGATVTEETFRGRFMLVFFGFTRCTDACPVAMQNVTLALEDLGAPADRVSVLFITVDGERDTSAVLADYVANFHPSVVGLTGSRARIAEAAKAYRVRYEHRHDRRGKASRDYLVDHSAYIYLMGPDGKYRHAFHHAASPEAIATRLREVMRADASAPGGPAAKR